MFQGIIILYLSKLFIYLHLDKYKHIYVALLSTKPKDQTKNHEDQVWETSAPVLHRVSVWHAKQYRVSTLALDASQRLKVSPHFWRHIEKGTRIVQAGSKMKTQIVWSSFHIIRTLYESCKKREAINSPMTMNHNSDQYIHNTTIGTLTFWWQLTND